MADERLRNKSELKRLFTNLRGKNITEEMMSIAIDSLWRDKLVQRTSGFEFPGHFDSEISFNTNTRIFSIKPWDPLVEGFKPRYGIYSYLDHPIFHRHFEPFEIETPNEEGLFCVYFDNEPQPGSSLILFYKKNPTQQELEDIYVSKILVSCFYWDATNNELLHFGEDRHGSEWNPHIQWYLHSVFGAKRKSGLQIAGFTLNGDGTLNSHATFGVTDGAILHDDIEMPITGKGPGLPILYAFGGLPRFIENNGYAFYSGASRPCFNSGLNSLAEADSGNFVLYHIFATNELVTEARKIISVMGTAQYPNLARAFKAIDSELDSIYTYMPFQGRCYLDTIILEVNDAYANDVKARIVYFGTGISHPPVTIHEESIQYLEIDEFQVLKMIGGGAGEDGITPHIGINGNWYIGDTDTGIPAEGQDGLTGADGQIGAPGSNGSNGNTPYIQGGYWYIDGVNTGVLATGQNGVPGADGDDGAPGTNGLNGIDAGGGFELCVTPGTAQTETIDLFASSNFTISKVVLESNGTLNSVTIKIGATAITGINAVAVSALQVFTPSGNNVVATGNRITIEIGTGFSGNPTIIRGKILA